jgi:SAM-dependent methyltransferase
MERMPDPENRPGVTVRMLDEDAPPADPSTVNDYDSFAAAYSAESDAGIINAYYERPAILALAGQVTGRRILDAGCGAGPIAAGLRDRGATVTGFDSSAGMIELARRRLGGDADLRVADLAGPLPYGDGVFDDVVASLVLHYLEDWGPALAEFRRVLVPGGRVIVAVNHPFATEVMNLLSGRKVTYLATYQATEEWTMGGQTALLSFWNRPVHAMTDAFTAAGFRISVISEPQPVPEAREIDPEGYRKLSANGCFLFFVLHAGPDA